ncbi:eukaryotic translation initiation factor SUI1 family protein [Klebsormidium nitens]|uniref:Eukaryotic translation initiation factor SUI1 family protein n=1 Tax=Klebsormidium nitens TaxID=105231 RepID=A0A1Y1HRI1_KLENI|nr:eukaryotic translation initiation factor SUI1 family protein [Klebsormidium nitens]|eukprot:GAQ79177.1 eukaryotic translation initiation factor SUI1 family protein [Klebsormidium nitens]
MFKKACPVHSSHRLSGADRKKLRRAMRDKFPTASEEDLDTILPAKGAAEVSVSKLANRSLLYGEDGGLPLLFDGDGRGHDIFPTVYALWKIPNLLPSFTLKGGEVSPYILSGADLMFPGVRVPTEGLPPFAAGEIYSVRVPGNPFPIAVGTTASSSAEAEKNGFRGKALKVYHYYRDALWDLPEGKYSPNEGFGEKMVMGIGAGEEAGNAEAPDGGNENGDANVHEGSGESLHEEGSDSGLEREVEGLTIDGAQAGGPGRELEGGEKGETETEGEKAAAAMRPEEMDRLLDECLLQALYTTVKDKDLPMPAGNLWSHHVLPARPPDAHVDIKKSTHKKLSKWLQAKATDGLVKVKEDKHRKELMLLSVDRGHAEYRAYHPVKRAQTAEGAAQPAASTSEADGQQLEVVEVFKPVKEVNAILQAVGADPSAYYSPQEVFALVMQYVQEQNLEKPSDRTTIVLDAPLCDALYKGKVKKGDTYPSEVPKANVGREFLARFQAHHRVSRGDKSATRKGALKNMQIVAEQRQGRKKVTKVTGLESFLVDPERLAEELQRKFASSSTVQEVPGKKDASEVLVQGGVLEDLGRYLVQQYGIPKKYIEIMDKTKRH